jgi:hypothetical protein
MKRGWGAWEKDSAHDLGLERTISSGNKFYDPGDAVTRGHSDFPLYSDAKYTERMSYSLRRQEMEHHIQRADEQGKRMILPVRIWPQGHLHPLDLAVLQLHDLKELLDGFQL